MKTKEEVTLEFKSKLDALLTEYDAELSAKDHYSGYSECGEDVRMTVCIPVRYAFNGDCLQEWTEIDLGRFLKPISVHW